MPSLKNYFELVVLINLRRRPDRLAQVKAAIHACAWPFKQPRVFPAIDGRTVPHPRKWKYGGSAWGCLQSHAAVLECALRDGAESILVLEDDVCFVEKFPDKVAGFLEIVPDDWDQLMLGGQHIKTFHGEPVLVRPGLYRCRDCERTHCYAVRGQYLRKLRQRWLGGGKFRGLGHCDWIMGRDRELQLAHQVYAPEYFLVGQERSSSDISGTIFPRQFFNPPGPELPVINLHAPQPVAAALREHGWYTGNIRDARTDLEQSLSQLFRETKKAPVQRVEKLRDWIKLKQWQVGSDPDFICTVWHPDADPRLVKAASLWPVYEITADTVKSALGQLPRKWRRPCLPIFV
jgi:hypothetical protein